MKLADIADPDKAGKDARTFHHKMVVEHPDLNIRTHDAVITMCDGVHDQLCPAEFWVLGNGPEDSALAEFSVFADLCPDKVRCLPHLVQQAAFERNILDDVHAVADFRCGSFKANESDTGAGEETLRVFPEQKDGRRVDLLFIAGSGDKALVVPEIISPVLFTLLQLRFAPNWNLTFQVTA